MGHGPWARGRRWRPARLRHILSKLGSGEGLSMSRHRLASSQVPTRTRMHAQALARTHTSCNARTQVCRKLQSRTTAREVSMWQRPLRLHCSLWSRRCHYGCCLQARQRLRSMCPSRVFVHPTHGMPQHFVTQALPHRATSHQVMPRHAASYLGIHMQKQEVVTSAHSRAISSSG